LAGEDGLSSRAKLFFLRRIIWTIDGHVTIIPFDFGVKGRCKAKWFLVSNIWATHGTKEISIDFKVKRSKVKGIG
jgi:hypothetical protein